MAWFFLWFTIPLSTIGTHITTCTMGDEDSWRVASAIFTPVNFLLIIFIILLRKHHVRLSESGRLLRNLIVPVCALYVIPYFVGSTLMGKHLCTVRTWENFDEYLPYSDMLASLWAPLQIFTLINVFLLSRWYSNLKRPQNVVHSVSES
jgi:hypothetical protein